MLIACLRTLQVATGAYRHEMSVTPYLQRVLGVSAVIDDFIIIIITLDSDQ